MKKKNSEETDKNVDVAKAEKSLSRLFEMYRNMAVKADSVMQSRCPYKDADSRCHAKFGCRNQFFTNDPTAVPVCAGSDLIDYKEAWDN